MMPLWWVAEGWRHPWAFCRLKESRGGWPGVLLRGTALESILIADGNSGGLSFRQDGGPCLRSLPCCSAILCEMGGALQSTTLGSLHGFGVPHVSLVCGPHRF